MPKALIRKKKRGPVKGTIKTKKHPQDRDARFGHEERLACFIKRTMQLKRDGWRLYEIADAIAIEYGLEKVPHISTVANWRKQGMDAITEDIQNLQQTILEDKFNELEQLLGKWFPIATADSLQIKRWVRIQGELQPEMDENATDEQLKAAKICADIVALQCKIMGATLERKDDDKKQMLDKDSIHLWIIGEVNKGIAAPGIIDVTAEARPILELKSGSEEIDELEGV